MSKRRAEEEVGRAQQGGEVSGDDAVPSYPPEMGEFEDAFEDEMESDEEVVVNGDEEEGEDEDSMDVDGKIQRAPEDEDMDGAEEEPQVYLPGDKLEKGQILEPDQSTYEMLHRMNVTWPCLSFDILRDHLGDLRAKFPHTAYFVAGTQADVAKNNEIMVMKASSLHKTKHDADLSDDEDEDEDDEDVDDDAVLEYRTIPTLGGVNRVRAAPMAPSADLEQSSATYPVATWSETGKVHIWNIRPLLNSLDTPGATLDRARVNTPIYTVGAHGRAEGYAMDWMGNNDSASRASSLRLVTGDVHSKIFLTTSTPSSFNTSPQPFESHTSSVEDLQWSPSEPTVFASCSADRSIRIWDVRIKARKSIIAVADAHEQDVNVISWNMGTQYLLASGGDEGGIHVWDLRKFQAGSAPAPKPVASFQWHTAPVTSIEWHRTEDSVFVASGADDQVTLWDLSVEIDDEEKGPSGGRLIGGKNGQPGREVPPQLLFVHQGQRDVKEVHFHPQIPGTVISTALTGFNIFKTISV